jgi:hypothetical protein
MALREQKSDQKKAELKQFEKAFNQIWAKESVKRQADKRDAFLTPDLLRRRKTVTKNGKQKLVLDFGSQGGKVSYTLADLNKMATAMGKAEGKFSESTRGVTVAELIRSSRKIDIQRAKKITNSTLYGVDGSILLFRAKASDDSKSSYHHVKVRLEDWEHEVRNGEGGAYLRAAAGAVRGKVSFDCDCGRHQYWYRYLATIGGFALDPKEFVFPKIRNPKLQGCCCKHVIKTLAVMQAPFVQSRIALEMKKRAAKKSGPTKKTFLGEDDLKAAESSGYANIEKEFNKMNRAKKGIQKKILTSAKEKAKKKAVKTMDAMLGKGSVAETVAKQLAKENTGLKRDILIGKLDNYLLRTVQIGKQPKDEAIKSFASENKMTVKEVETLGKEANIL